LRAAGLKRVTFDEDCELWCKYDDEEVLGLDCSREEKRKRRKKEGRARFWRII
jgi:hypothetical protein